MICTGKVGIVVADHVGGEDAEDDDDADGSGCALCNRSDTALRVDISEQEGRDCLIERI